MLVVLSAFESAGDI